MTQKPGSSESGFDESGRRLGGAESGGHLDDVAGIVLAGVHPWGECCLERVLPRPLMPVAGRSLVWHAVNWLQRGGVREAVVCANGGTRALRAALGDDAGLSITLGYFEDPMPRGPAGCARDAAATSGAQLFVVVDGTVIPRLELRSLLSAHVASEAALTVVARANGPWGQGDGGSLEPAGIYVFSRAALEQVSTVGYQDIKEWVIPDLHRRGYRVRAYTIKDASLPRVIGPESYLAVSMWAAHRIAECSLPDGYSAVADAWIHASARVADSARLIGPVLVGPECVVEEQAMVVGPTTLGQASALGRGCTVSRSVLWDGCRVGAGAVVDRCILATAADVEPEYVVRNTVYFARRWGGWTALGRRVSEWVTGNGKASSASDPVRGVGLRRRVGGR
ncbi:MAG: NDP-sugar synthase [Phycisphaerales bacterium]|nr:MAG: NDP-sugar synthase [Phycisphaerales bacterium]